MLAQQADQAASAGTAAPAGSDRSLERSFLPHLLDDQREFWLGPRTLDFAGAQKLVLFGGAAAALFVTDRDNMKHHFQSPTLVQRSSTFSNAALFALGGSTAGMYLWGRWKGDDHKTETGILALEAATDSLMVSEGMKFVAGRQRPSEGDGTGSFRMGGSSFPSEHSAAAWSIATVIANEYPGPLTKIFAYGAASAISVSRISSRNHFPSDVLIGSAMGWYFGHQVYQSHHRGDLGGNSIGTFYRNGDKPRNYRPASSYVPLDSWIYPALDRLTALGVVRGGFAGLRPWTRLQCAGMIQNAEDMREADALSNEPAQLVKELAAEFRPEREILEGSSSVSAQVDSLYTRVTGITGQPLSDGYHFAQTITNDFGRPYAEGFNNVSGISAHVNAGPFAFFAQAEYQYSPSSSALPLTARQTIQSVDELPANLLPPSGPNPAVNRLHLLDTYVTTDLSNWQLSFGRQSLWWGPERTGPMLLSDNAEPINMFRIDRVTPLRLPGLLKYLGSVRTEFFLGQLDGYDFITGPNGLTGSFTQPLSRQPFIHGEKVSFKPTPNLEFGFSRTTLFAGSVFPLTLGRFGDSLFSLGNLSAGNENKPGDRRSAFDFTYRIPRLRNWLTFYADGFTDDQFTPVAYWDRSSWTAGLYLPKLPKLHKMDLRAEGVFTDLPIGGNVSDGFFYYNVTWRSGYTNDGNLLGSWIGRQGQGAQAWSTYHLNARSFVEASFRHQKVSHEFLPQGGSLTDAGLRAAFTLNREVSLSGGVQWERWLFPVIAQTPQRDVTSSIQLTVQPGRWGKLLLRK